jgi:hypothetical protein
MCFAALLRIPRELLLKGEPSGNLTISPRGRLLSIARLEVAKPKDDINIER